MATKLTGIFETRRQAEMAVERLVQEFGVSADDTEITASGLKNTVGTRPAGSDKTDGTSYPKERNDDPTEGSVQVAVNTEGDNSADQIRKAFSEFGALRVNAS